MKYIYILIVIICNIGAHILFKFASMELANKMSFFFLATNWKIIVGGILQVTALLAWIKLLQCVELNWAALMSALIPLGLIIVSVIIFNETLSVSRIIGAVLIITGIYIIN